MLFNSLTVGVFFVITYALYICMRHRMQNVLLGCARHDPSVQRPETAAKNHLKCDDRHVSEITKVDCVTPCSA